MADKRAFVYGSFVLSIIGLFIVLGSGGSAFALVGDILAALGALCTILFLKYDYFFLPAVMQRKKTVTLNEGQYEVATTGDAIVKLINGTYYASSFLEIKIFESTTTKTPEEVVSYNENFERAISNLKYVTKIAFMLFVEDIGKKRRLIEAKKNEARIKLGKERENAKKDPLKLSVLEREVAAWNLQIEEMNQGPQPMGLRAYAAVAGTGSSKEEAIAVARSEANELKTTLKNSLNVEIEILSEKEMLKCFEWDLYYPTTAGEL